MIRLIVTVLGVGRLPVASGTWGSLAALPAGYLLHWAGGPFLLVGATAAVLGLGLWAVGLHTAGDADPDRSEIVIDEVAGQWIALLPLSFGLWHAGVAPHVFPWPGWVAAFFLFRLFDILKPWPINRADAMKTPFGVMLDDVLAGIAAALLVGISAMIAHGAANVLTSGPG